ncbi:nicotinamide-nucleotide amidohydrolase family protein [Aeromicrobium sp. IC_218]|uniref:CinA family protein n=1 Tax=Aeromicrobium sp. IC_218 TaxID=2545468 RepID=UPI00103A2370|nr:nicotinamide-nucleotide amidohydrolase family protein [Aeromicrobium sp. IC_218]TCJ00246.1 nicotinamide-nucleotide amidohydrolase family protein [Aeromicrobium sp. IC_218]
MTADVAERAVALLRERGESVATAESLTGGRVCAALVDVPGASVVVRGGVVAYAADLKTELLGVPANLVAERGTVDADVAAAMAEGVRVRLGATWGVSTTGVAGPGPSEGKPQGTVHVAVAGPDGVRGELLALPGDRDDVRSSTVLAGLSLLVARLGEHLGPRTG